MKGKDIIILVCLFLLALFIWFRQTIWIDTSDDTLPILVALPLFAWMGHPWKFRTDEVPLSVPKIVVSIFCFLFGILTNLTILLTIGWTLILWTWLSARTVSKTHDSIKKLLILPLMAFPWVALDADRIGWWFRLYGAYATAKFFSLLGFDVTQDGTNLVINKIPFSVEVACAGLNTLQAMIIAGSIIAYIYLGKSSLYWWNLPVLVAMAWFANTLRIITLSMAALTVSPQFAIGAFHTWGGWGVLMLMFILCWILFSFQQKYLLKNI